MVLKILLPGSPDTALGKILLYLSQEQVSAMLAFPGHQGYCMNSEILKIPAADGE